MKAFKRLIVAIAFSALMMTILNQAIADTVNVPKNKPALIVTTVLGKNVSTNVLTFADEHEAIEFENQLLAENPVTNPLKPYKKPVYFVTKVFTN